MTQLEQRGPSARSRTFSRSRSPDFGFEEEKKETFMEKAWTFRESIRGDERSIFVLFLLYVMQGLPMGLAGLVPLLLIEKGASMSDVGTFSINVLPYSVKLLWAPIVDAIFIKSMGRRKTWLIPCQLAIGIVLLLAPIEESVERAEAWPLTVIFLCLYFFCATQDIAVDGWCLTMLSPKNVTIGSTCNVVGQNVGFFISLAGFLALKDFGILTLGQYCQLSGVSFIIVTLAIWAMKHEKEDTDIDDVITTYKGFFKMLKLPSLRRLLSIMVVWKLPFALSSVASLKVQEAGVTKETMAILSTAMLPVGILVPLMIVKSTAGPRPLDVVAGQYLPRCLFNGVLAALVYYTRESNHDFSKFYYVLMVVISIADSYFSTSLFTSQMAFFTRVSDPGLGGSYMTFLNTCANLGSMWTIIVSLKICDALTTPLLDGFYALAIILTVVPALWYTAIGRHSISRVSQIPIDEWHLAPSA